MTYAPYSKEGWEEHQRHLEELLARIKAGKVKIRSAYITNPNYGGYSYTEDERIRGMVEYADPAEVLLIAETGGLNYVSLAGGWWPEAGFQGYGQTIPVSLARARLPEWKAIFLGTLPSRREATEPYLRGRGSSSGGKPWLPFPDPLGIVERATEEAPVQLRDPLRRRPAGGASTQAATATEIEEISRSVGMWPSAQEYARQVVPNLNLSRSDVIDLFRIAIVCARLDRPPSELVDVRHLAEATHYITQGGLSVALKAAQEAGAPQSVERIRQIQRELEREKPLATLT